MQKFKNTLKNICRFIICFTLLAAVALLAINFYVVGSGGKRIIKTDDAAMLKDVDCIVILGCQVKPNGTPSDMLRDRLDKGIELYKAGTAPKILMSGDHGTKEYNEVKYMKKYAVEQGVPSEDIFCDHAGFSTYESMHRANSIFDADKIVVVTQKYHLYRATYIASNLGIDVYGVCSDYHTYRGQYIRDTREILARIKDFFSCIIKPDPTYLGDAIPVSGNGDVTN